MGVSSTPRTALVAVLAEGITQREVEHVCGRVVLGDQSAPGVVYLLYDLPTHHAPS